MNPPELSSRAMRSTARGLPALRLTPTWFQSARMARRALPGGAMSVYLPPCAPKRLATDTLPYVRVTHPGNN